LLRPRRERPRRCPAPEQRDELATLHSITSSARASSDVGTSRPSNFAVWLQVGYKVVRVRADADLPHRLIHFRICKHPVTAMDGQHVPKYFLVRRAKVKQQP
jgi:hypothetical protein